MATVKWKAAAKKAMKLKDPWKDMDFDTLPERKATRHVYNPRSKSWWKDDVMIKIQEKSFAKGAMRECYRMKKLSKFSTQPDWSNASNYVAKCYMTDQPRTVYEQDVKLQMDSKLWGEKYNKRNPPKKVDFFQAYLVELKEPINGRTLFCVEHFMEGNYIKYNSNSGYISDVYRLTPQAFSHFTFEKSDHQLIVVDIQGVGDLYTDPQIHTMDMKDYGEANLGSKGMALFFSSHLCSPLCSALGLKQFDLSSEELSRINVQGWEDQSSTVITPTEEKAMASCLGKKRESLSDVFQRVADNFPLGSLPSPALTRRLDSFETEGSPLGTPEDQKFSFEDALRKNVSDNNLEGMQRRRRNDSSESDTATRVTENVSRKRITTKSASVSELTGMEYIKEKLKCLGEVHYEMALYHSIGRFTSDPDLTASLFHLHKAGECGVSLALYELGCIYQQLPHNELENLSVESSPAHETMGLEYMIQAADNDYRPAMIIAGRILETGDGIGTRQKDWVEAVMWYTKALETTEVTDDSPEPDYNILARLANMYSNGGFDLLVDHQKAGDYYQQAADIAMEEMKGKLANKYYMMAEEEWSKEM